MRAGGTASPQFGRLARVYRALEFLAFGGDLEAARFAFLSRLAEANSLLVLGEGDGRCLARLGRIAPAAQIDCIELSPAMVARAKARLSARGLGERVRFITGDVFAQSLPRDHYDGVVTFFFLDCFSSAQVATLVEKVSPSLRPGALWLFADFVLPAAGWRRWRAQLWLGVLYAFFRWGTGLATRRLPDSEAALAAAGWKPEATRGWQHGLLRSSVLKRAITGD